MPSDEKPPEEGIATPPPRRPKGRETLHIERTQARADNALENERDARDQSIQLLQDANTRTVSVLETQLAAERSKNKWMTRIFVAGFLLVLVMLGVSVGLIQTGTINFPGLGTVDVGKDAQPEAPKN